MTRLHRLLQSVAETDTRASPLDDGSWVVPCLHCQSKVALGPTGAPLGPATLEHIVPRSWFGRAAARELTARVGDVNAPPNLAVACARCNQRKGKTHDADGPASARAREVVAALRDRRAARLKEG